MIMTMAEKEIRICSCCSPENVPLNTRSGHGHMSRLGWGPKRTYQIMHFVLSAV